MRKAQKANFWLFKVLAALAVAGAGLCWFGLAPEPARQTSVPRLKAFEPAAFVREQKARTFREAQLRYFSGRPFDSAMLRYTDGVERPPAWGPLPYPPLTKVSSSDDGPVGPTEPGAWLTAAGEAELDRLTGFDLTRNDEVTLWNDGEALLPMRKTVENARRFLLVNMLALACDAGSEPLIAAIEARARAGVDVRLIIGRSYAWLSGSCLARLHSAGVSIVKAPTHSSYLVNDRGEVVIGSESVASTWFDATGTDFLDRDLMVSARGPLATDAIGDFLAVWDESQQAGERDTRELAGEFRRRLEAETAEQARGAQHYRDWLALGMRGLCRFVAQRPSRNPHAELLLEWLIRHASRRIVFSGVKVGLATPMVTAAASRAHSGEVRVDFLGNGWLGGNGELTMVLDDSATRLDAAGWPRLARAIRLVRDWDRGLQAARRAASYAELAAAGPVGIWQYFGFLHHKTWLFDRDALWVGSMNPDVDSRKESEAGVFCVDQALASRLSEALARDRANSIPHGSFSGRGGATD